jgi:hypothetical protein
VKLRLIAPPPTKNPTLKEGALPRTIEKSSHTFSWISENGERIWVKYHFKTKQGI